jgi:hypothetical protein
MQMSIASGYVTCICLSGAVLLVATQMFWMGVLRRGQGAELDDGAARMLTLIGVMLILALAAFWIYALPMMPTRVLNLLQQFS